MGNMHSIAKALEHVGGKVQLVKTPDELSDSSRIVLPGVGAFRDCSAALKESELGEAIKEKCAEGVPYLGICLGMQLAVVEFARAKLKLAKANSIEMDAKTPDPVIYLIKEWFDYRTNEMQLRNEESDLGGTLRLGAYPCVLKKDTRASQAYDNVDEISERHRHRYEFNNDYRQRLEEKGLVISGASPDDNLVEIVEIEDHPWFLGCQFHPEFKSKPMKPHPLFKDFIAAALKKKQERH